MSSENHTDKKISKAVISRLPAYYRHLRDLIEQGTERVSSGELSSIMHITASQIRQDLNQFGGFGQQGYGYNVINLHKEIGTILGVDYPHRMILVGCGNLGKALVNYKGFVDNGFQFVGLFDSDPGICGSRICQLTVAPIDELGSFLRGNRDIDIAVISVPRNAARSTAEVLYDLGIRNFWNFAHTELELPSECTVKSVHLLDSLLELSFELSINK